MDPKHQAIIRANLSTLVKKMNAVPVAEHLNASRIITDEMKEQIETEKTSFDRNRKLLNIFVHRGPRAFKALRAALMKTNQNVLSQLLYVDDDITPTEYKKKLAAARSLLIDVGKKKVAKNIETNRPSSVCRQHSEESRCRISLDNIDDLWLTATPYNGAINIHLRHFTRYGDRVFATKKGVTFPLPRWLKFESLLPDIDEYLESHGKEEQELKWHVGGGVYITLNPNYRTVDIRHYWKPNDSLEPVPTKKGVTLNKDKFGCLKDAVEKIHEYVPELNDTELCILDESHQNQLGMLNCPECSPFGYEPDVDQWSVECNVGDLDDMHDLEIDTDNWLGN